MIVPGENRKEERGKVARGPDQMNGKKLREVMKEVKRIREKGKKKGGRMNDRNCQKS